MITRVFRFLARFPTCSNMQEQQHQGFVRVCPSDRTRFEADGRPFFFAGANCYYLLASAPT